MKKTQISFDIELDENKIPEKINWSANDGGIKNKESKAVFLSVWDHEPQETLKIDLWTKDMLGVVDRPRSTTSIPIDTKED